MTDKRANAGATLVEILVAVIVLGLSTSVILNAVVTGNHAANYALRRGRVFELLQSRIEEVRAIAKTGTIVVGSTSAPVVLPGFEAPVNVTVNITARVDSTKLFDVAAQAAWSERTNIAVRLDSANLATIVRDR